MQSINAEEVHSSPGPMGITQRQWQGSFQSEANPRNRCSGILGSGGKKSRVLSRRSPIGPSAFSFRGVLQPCGCRFLPDPCQGWAPVPVD